MNIGRIGGRLIAGAAVVPALLMAFAGPASVAVGDITAADKSETVSLGRLVGAGPGKSAAPEPVAVSTSAAPEPSRPVG